MAELATAPIQRNTTQGVEEFIAKGGMPFSRDENVLLTDPRSGETGYAYGSEVPALLESGYKLSTPKEKFEYEYKESISKGGADKAYAGILEFLGTATASLSDELLAKEYGEDFVKYRKALREEYKVPTALGMIGGAILPGKVGAGGIISALGESITSKLASKAAGNIFSKAAKAAGVGAVRGGVEAALWQGAMENTNRVLGQPFNPDLAAEMYLGGIGLGAGIGSILGIGGALAPAIRKSSSEIADDLKQWFDKKANIKAIKSATGGLYSNVKRAFSPGKINEYTEWATENAGAAIRRMKLNISDKFPFVQSAEDLAGRLTGAMDEWGNRLNGFVDNIETLLKQQPASAQKYIHANAKDIVTRMRSEVLDPIKKAEYAYEPATISRLEEQVKIIEDALIKKYHPTGVSFKELNEIKRNFDKVAYANGTQFSTDPYILRLREFRRIINEEHEAMLGRMSQSNLIDPQVMRNFQEIKENVGVLDKLRSVAYDAAYRDNFSRRTVSPSDYVAAGAGGIMSGDVFGGVAFGTINHVLRTYGNSGLSAFYGGVSEAQRFLNGVAKTYVGIRDNARAFISGAAYPSIGKRGGEDKRTYTKEDIKQINNALSEIKSSPALMQNKIQEFISKDSKPEEVNSTVALRTAAIAMVLDAYLPKQKSDTLTQEDRFEPSKADLAKVNRMMSLIDNPVKFMEYLNKGTVTAEDSKLMLQLYPALMQEMNNQIMRELADTGKKLNYHKRLLLNRAFGMQTDPSLNNMGILQNFGNPQSIQTQAQQMQGVSEQYRTDTSFETLR